MEIVGIAPLIKFVAFSTCFRRWNPDKKCGIFEAKVEHHPK